MRVGSYKSSPLPAFFLNRVAPEPKAQVPGWDGQDLCIDGRPLSPHASSLFLTKSNKYKNYKALEHFGKAMPLHVQGLSNSCGTTALAMALASLGIPGDRRVLDRSVRIFKPEPGGATFPGGLVDTAQRIGLQATQFDGADFEVLCQHVWKGLPAIVLLNYSNYRSETEEGQAHFVNVVGVEWGKNDEIDRVIFMNPHGTEEDLSYEQFMQQWSNVCYARKGVGAVLATYHRHMILLARPEDEILPSPNLQGMLSTLSSDVFGSGSNGFSSSIETIKRGFPIAGSLQLIGALTNTLVGVPAFVLGNLIGKNIQRLGERLERKAPDSDQGMGAQILGFWRSLFPRTIRAIGWAFTILGGLVAACGALISRPLRQPRNRSLGRCELREMILNPNRRGGIEDPAIVLQRASCRTRIQMLETLLGGSRPLRAKPKIAPFAALNSRPKTADSQPISSYWARSAKVLRRFSDNLLGGWRSTTTADELAALAILNSITNPADLDKIAAHFVSPFALVRRFSGERAGAVSQIFNLPT